jgi:hypothetical protein
MSTNDLKEFLDEWQYKIFLLFVFLASVFQIIKALYRELGIGEALKKRRRMRKIRRRKAD